MPFGLLALYGTGHTAVAVELDEYNRRHFAEKYEIDKPFNQCIRHERRNESRRDEPCNIYD